MMFKDKQNESIVIKTRIAVTSGKSGDRAEDEQLSGVKDMFCILLFVGVTWGHTYIQIHRAIHQ